MQAITPNRERITDMQIIDIPEQTPSSELDKEILEIFVEEVGEILENIITHFKAFQNEPANSESLKELRRGFHTLKGSGRLVGATVIGELGWRFENMLNKVIDGTLSRNNDMLSLIEQVEKVLPSLLAQFQDNQPPPDDVVLLISQADYLTHHSDSHQSPREPPHKDELVEPLDLSDLELELSALDLPEGEPLLKPLSEGELELSALDLPEGEPLLEPLSEGELELSALDLPEGEPLLEPLSEGELELSALDLPEGEPLLEPLSEGEQKLESPSAPKKPPGPSTPAAEEPPDEVKEIFLEEADEIIEKTQSMLERWIAEPNNMQLMKDLQRQLHTLKGGARMVGIVPLGDLSHQMEDILKRIVEGTAQSNTRLQEIVQNSVDELATMLEAVRDHVVLDIPTDLIKQINAALGVEGATPADAPPVTNDESSQFDKAQEKDEAPTDSGEERIRVKATIIDQLTNLAGELSISRAHSQQQQEYFRNNLVEMDQTVIRLRDQLRRFEIETEAQMMSHFEDDDKEFDPLELDRFSDIQHLSRSLGESVDDLMNIQDYLKTLTRHSESLLVQQSSIGAELQDCIMRTRMIPFARISPRLQRIVRREAREQKKPVKFIVNGENIEFEKTVLDRVVTPLEHMLRNAIGHGVEDAKTRQQAGKPSVAKITIDLSREGAELIIKLSDDGAGLNLPAIRKKAEKQGLIQPDTVVNDHDLMQLILKAGFSTAKKLTQSQGRGVGMDIVNDGIKQLNGSLQIHSKTGEGMTFEIRLPLSLTITQALLVQIGEETMAVPINYLEAVMRTSRSEVLGEPDEVRYYKYMDNSYRVFHLGELLGFGKEASVDSPLIPTLLVRAADRRVALLVDAIEGSKEIVVKPVGPQIDAIRWIAGATLLGDGRVVLVLDVPTTVREETILRSQPPQRTEIVKEEKHVAKVIMVVDDSITVRKVTATLLKRQGMEVITAKDGLDAVANLQDNIPDLILLDVEMPRMDGYELATQVRNNQDWKHLPIIMISSRMGPKHKERADKIGVNRYLGKPYKEAELLENINALLADSEQRVGDGVANPVQH
ncbi:MAG: Hpt domain-containing protein [Pseudomonadota bacterium]